MSVPHVSSSGNNQHGTHTNQIEGHRCYPPNLCIGNGEPYTQKESVKAMAVARRTMVQPPASALPPLPASLGNTNTSLQRFSAASRIGAAGSSSHSDIKRPYPSEFGNGPIISRKTARPVEKSKGLRHFSHKVCEKVQLKGRTNYSEVADELVNEYFSSQDHCSGDEQQDMKNIRRRVYDALNVFMAMNIIEKEKKEIRWVGLPTSSVQECTKLKEERIQLQNSIREKTAQLQDLITQLVAFKCLVERNRENERRTDISSGRSDSTQQDQATLYLPFVVISTEKKACVECKISNDKSEYSFSFDRLFEIDDDIEVLKRLGMALGLESGKIAPDKRSVFKEILPRAVQEHLDEIFAPDVFEQMEHSSKSHSHMPANPEPRNVNYNIAPVTHYGGNQGHNTIITSQSRSYNEAQPAMVRSSQTQYAVMQRSSAQVPPGTFTMRNPTNTSIRYRIPQADTRQLPQRGIIHRVVSTGRNPMNQFAMQSRQYEEEYDDDENVQF